MVVARRPAAAAAQRPQVPRMDRQRVVSNARETAAANTGGATYNLPYEYYKPTKGSVIMRILPYLVTDPNHPDHVPVGQLWYRRPMKVHFNIGSDEKAYICPATIGLPCPVCEYILQKKKEGTLDKSEHDSIKAKDRDLFIIQTIINNTLSDIMSMEISFYNFTKQLVREIDDVPEERAGFADLIDGLDLRVRFAEERMGAGKPFPKADRIDFLARKNPPDPAILSTLPSLDDCLTILPYKELEAIFMGIAVPKEDGNDDSYPVEDEISFDGEPEPEPEPELEPEPEPEQASPARRPPVKRQANTAPEPPAPPVRRAAPTPQVATPSPVRRKSATPAPAPEPEPEPTEPVADGTCPVGGVFGEDCNALEECDSCPADVWQECQAKFDQLTAEKRAGKQ